VPSEMSPSSQLDIMASHPHYSCLLMRAPFSPPLSL
jgi:hypothetical protein